MLGNTCDNKKKQDLAQLDITGLHNKTINSPILEYSQKCFKLILKFYSKILKNMSQIFSP